MAVPLLLLNLPFLLLFLLVLCGRKKKKSNEEAPSAPNKPEKSKESQKEAPPPVSTSNADGNPSASMEKSIEPKEIKEEETQDTSEEKEIKLANIILKIHKDFNEKKIQEEERDRRRSERAKKRRHRPRSLMDDRPVAWNRQATYQARVENDYSNAKQAYQAHECTHPEKKRTEDERCDVCKAYFDWIGRLYELHYNHCSIRATVNKIFEDYYDYGGKLPSFLENAEWEKIKEQMKKDMGTKMKLDPLVGTPEERERQNTNRLDKFRLIIDHVNYWTSPEDEFRQRIAKDFEEARKVYREHDCRGIPGSLVGFSYHCSICLWYMSERWAGRLYKEVMENEKRFPDGMKKQLEEDFFFHQQKFGKNLPMFVENWRWVEAKKRIEEERAKKKKQKKPKSEQNKANRHI